MSNQGRRTIARIRQDATGVRVQYEDGRVAVLSAAEADALLALLGGFHRDDRKPANAQLYEESERLAEELWKEKAAMAVKRGVVWREIPKNLREFYRGEARKQLAP